MSSGYGSPDPYRYDQSNTQPPTGPYDQPVQTPQHPGGQYQGDPYQGSAFQGNPIHGAPAQHGQPYPLQPAAYQSGPYAMAPEHPQGTTILVLGLVSIAVPIVGFVAWYMGSRTQREIAETGAVYSNVGNITAGKIVGMITSILTMVGFAIFIVYIIFFVIVLAGMSANMP